MRISCGREGNGTQGTCAESVGGIVVIKKLDILPELKPHTIVVGDASAGDNSSLAHRVGDSVFPRESVEAAHNIRYHVCNHQTRETFEKQTMGAGTQPLFDGSNGPLHLANVATGWHDIQLDWVQGLADALELIVGVDVAYGNDLIPREAL